VETRSVRKAVFLDRDGVINRGIVDEGRPFAPASLAEFEILPGVPEALEKLRAAGYLLVVCTNQPDVRRGEMKRADVEAIHARMRSELALDDIRVCFHDDRDNCACRKPKPGLIIAAAVDWEVQLTRSFMVGDRWRDIDAGKAAGCMPILVNRFPEPVHIEPLVEFADLAAAAEWILSRDDVTRSALK
jgi:D-glycero-D-manno-heptose 1,7-bisphosphate phosphatase